LDGNVGFDYVGLPLSLAYAEVAYRVLGLDIDQVTADAII
jgi:UDP-N-acetyl-D-mannosaminuronate dehydrogenase